MLEALSGLIRVALRISRVFQANFFGTSSVLLWLRIAETTVLR